MKKLSHLFLSFLFILFGLFGIVNNGYGTTYKLTQVTSVSAGNKYVFVHEGYALTGAINQKKLQSTSSYNTTLLEGTESYVWALESASSYFKIKSPYNSNKCLNNKSGNTEMTFDDTSTADWEFVFSGNNALIRNVNDNNRFIGETSDDSHEYKAYAESNLDVHDHDILVYRLDEEECTGTYTITFVNKNTNETYESELIDGGQHDITEVADDYMLWEFDGWGIDSTDYLSVTSRINLTSDTTLYAFFKYGNYGYVLVEREPDVWDGEYLIVNHDSVVAFNGGLSTLDATYDTIKVNIENKTIPVNSITKQAQFTITSKIGGYSILSESGKYIGRTSNNKNGLDESINDDYVNTITFKSSDTIDIIGSSGSYLRFNGNKDQVRFRFFKSDTYTNQKPIQLYKKTLAELYCTNPSNIQIVEWLKDSIKLDINNYDSIKIGDNWELLTTEQDGTHKAYVENLQNKSCTDLIVKTRKDNRTDCINVFKVPIFAGQHTEINNEDCDVIILKDSIFTPSDNIENKDVTIYPKGTLVIPSGVTYTTNSLTLRRDNNKVPQFKYNGTLTGKLYFELRTDGVDWRWLTLPDMFNTSDMITDNVFVKYYDGAWRASNGSGGWKMAESKSFTSGQGYIFGIDVTPETKKKIYQIKLNTSVLEAEKSSKSVQVYPYGKGTTAPPNDLGWNVIGNPFMDECYISSTNPIRYGLLKKVNPENWNGQWEVDSIGDEHVKYIVIKDTGEQYASANYYKAVPLQTGIKLPPFVSFFIQADTTISDEGSAVIFSKASGEGAAMIPTKTKQQSEEVFLQLNVGNKQTGCFISDKYNDIYEINADLESFDTNLYQLINGYKLIYSAVNDSMVNNGIYIHGYGNVSLNEETDVNRFSELSILYNNNYYNLLQGETVSVNGEFVLFAKRKNNTTTDLEVPEYNSIMKVLYNNRIYIIKNNNIYNIFGNKLR